MLECFPIGKEKAALRAAEKEADNTAETPSPVPTGRQVRPIPKPARAAAPDAIPRRSVLFRTPLRFGAPARHFPSNPRKIRVRHLMKNPSPDHAESGTCVERVEVEV